MYKRLLAICLSTVLLLAVTQPAAQGINDPMRPLNMPPPSQQGEAAKPLRYTLESIIIAGERRHAVINGKRLSAGEQLGPATIQHIDAGQVILRIGQREHILTMLPVNIKTPSDEAAP